MLDLFLREGVDNKSGILSYHKLVKKEEIRWINFSSHSEYSTSRVLCVTLFLWNFFTCWILELNYWQKNKRLQCLFIVHQLWKYKVQGVFAGTPQKRQILPPNVICHNSLLGGPSWKTHYSNAAVTAVIEVNLTLNHRAFSLRSTQCSLVLCRHITALIVSSHSTTSHRQT